jgi:diguanylate cyclase (GGDEF)-like protein
MHIGRPWTDVNGERFISISRRIPAPDGSFDGVVVGTLNLTYFIDLFNKVHLHEGDTLNLVQSDGRIVMRAPFNGDVIDADLSASTMFQRMTREGTGSFVSSWSHDGVERLFVFQQVGNAQLTMYYSLPLASIYSGWWVQTLRLFTIVAPVSVTNIMLIAFLARALKRSAKAEYHLALAALTDSLTGLFNRRHFDKVLDEEWRLAMRGQTPIGMLMIDADNFKAFNDGFGHQAGDTALIAIAGCIGAGARCEIDICARYCGEEFAVLLPGVAAKEAFGIAERIREGVMVLREKQDGRADKTPTVSIGVASMIPRPGLQAHDLIQKADVALYHAKANGRNRCELEDAPKTASWLPVIVGSELPLVAETNESRAPV